MKYRVEPMEDFFVVLGAYEGEGDDRVCFKGTRKQCDKYMNKIKDTLNVLPIDDVIDYMIRSKEEGTTHLEIPVDMGWEYFKPCVMVEAPMVEFE